MSKMERRIARRATKDERPRPKDRRTAAEFAAWEDVQRRAYAEVMAARATGDPFLDPDRD